MNRKVNTFKQSFYRNSVWCQKFMTSVQSAVFQPWHRPTIILPPIYSHVDDTSFEVSPEIHCSGVSSRYCCYGNHAPGSKPI